MKDNNSSQQPAAEQTKSQRLEKWILFLFIGITLSTGCAQMIMKDVHASRHIVRDTPLPAEEDTPVKLGL
jgi:hypothetical protein